MSTFANLIQSYLPKPIQPAPVATQPVAAPAQSAPVASYVQQAMTNRAPQPTFQTLTAAKPAGMASYLGPAVDQNGLATNANGTYATATADFAKAAADTAATSTTSSILGPRPQAAGLAQKQWDAGKAALDALGPRPAGEAGAAWDLNAKAAVKNATVTTESENYALGKQGEWDVHQGDFNKYLSPEMMTALGGYDPNYQINGFDVTNSDAYKQRSKAATDAIEGSAAAKGVLRSGKTLKAINSAVQNVASEEYQNEYNRKAADYQRGLGAYTQGLNNAQSQQNGIFDRQIRTATLGDPGKELAINDKRIDASNEKYTSIINSETNASNGLRKLMELGGVTQAELTQVLAGIDASQMEAKYQGIKNLVSGGLDLGAALVTSGLKKKGKE